MLAGTVSAGTHFSDPFKKAANRVTGFIYNDQFDAAANTLDSLSTALPGNPVVPLFRAVLYQSEMMAEESDRLEDDFYSLLAKVKIGADSMLAAGGDSALAWYFAGQADALRSLRRGRSGHTWGALKAGLSAGRAYSKGYSADSQFFDIGLGLGSYRYWKSVKGKFLTWAFLLKNEKEEGIELVRLAVDSSEISSDAAVTSLIWIYLNEERYPEAIRLAESMHEKYPLGLTFVWALGETYRGMHDWRTAADYYRRILERLKSAPGNYYNIIEASYYLVICYRQIGDIDSTSDVYTKQVQADLRACPIPDNIRKRQSKKIDFILHEDRH